MRMAYNGTRLARLWSAPARWANGQPWADALFEFGFRLPIVLVGVWLVLYVPVAVLLFVSRAASRKGPSGMPVELSKTSIWVLMITLALTAVFSAVLAGFTRDFLARSVKHRWWALLFVLAGAALPIWLAHMFRPLATLPDVRSGDAPLVLSYLAAWLLLVGYVSKVPWDHTRDLWACRFKQLRSPMTGTTALKSPGDDVRS